MHEDINIISKCDNKTAKQQWIELFSHIDYRNPFLVTFPWLITMVDGINNIYYIW
jgi:hypothetical protein